jgi:short-subunit dehydrogenase
MSNSQSAVLISGASSGIGRACALHLDKNGFLVFAGVRKEEDLQSLKESGSDRLTPIFLDITQPQQIEAAVETVRNHPDKPRVVAIINNAGIVLMEPYETMNLDQLRYQFEVNLFGHIAMTQAFLPLLRENRGRVINMSSTGGSFSSPFLGPYHATKHALESFSDSLRMELRPWDIPVVIIVPASTDTPIWEKSLQAAQKRLQEKGERAEKLYRKSFEKMARATENLGKAGTTPEKVAEVVYRALTAEKPRTRYLIGPQAFALVLLQFLPDRWRDRLILRWAGLLG